MASGKRIEFSASLNAQSFNEELSRIEKRLKNAGKDTGITTGLAKVLPQLKNLGINIDKTTSGIFGDRAKKGMRDLDQHIKKQIKDLSTLGNIEDRRSNKIKDFKNQLKGINSETNDYKNIQQQIVNLQEKQNKNLITQEAKTSSLLKSTSQLGSIQKSMAQGGGSGGGSGGGGMGRLDIMKGIFSSAGKAGMMTAGIMAPLMGGANLAAQYYGYQAQIPRIESQATAQTIRGVQRAPRAFLEGRGHEEMLFQKAGILEKSLGQAKTVIDAERKKDKALAALGLGGVATTTAAGATAGSLAGAYGGGTIGGILGNLPGAALGSSAGFVGGGIIGGLMGGGGSLYALAQQRFGRSLLNPEVYNKEMNAQTVIEYNRFNEQNKEKIELRKRGMNYIKDRSPSYLKAQRTLGFSDRDLFGGTIGRSSNEANMFGQTTGTGFTKGLLGSNSDFEESDVLGTAQNIANVGGSRGVGRNTRAALLARRNNNVMGAGGIIGRLQATGANGDEAFKKILAEGMTIGLDNSNMAREQEKFATTVSSMVFAQGKGTDSGQMASLMATMAGEDPTMRSLMATPGAMQGLNRLSSNTKGVRGMQQAAMIEKQFKGLNSFAKLELQGIGITEAATGSERMTGLAMQEGMDPEEFGKKLFKLKAKSMTVTLQAEEEIAKLRSGNLSTDETKLARSRLSSSMFATSTPFSNMDNERREQVINVLATGEMAPPSKKQPSLGPKGDERIGDTVSKMTSAIEKAFRNLAKMKDMQENFSAAGQMAPMTVTFGDKLAKEMETIEDGGEKAAEALSRIHDEMVKIINIETEKNKDTSNSSGASNTNNNLFSPIQEGTR